MGSHSPCLPRCDHHVQGFIAVRAMTQMPQNLVNIHYYTLLHITACITIIEPGILARIMDNHKAHL